MRPRWQTAVAASSILVTVVTLAGCRTARQVAAQYPKSDIESIYADSMSNPDRNPVVLVHGFGGSILRRTEDGGTVWGAFFTKDSLPPAKRPGLTGFALDVDSIDPPIDPGRLIEIEDDVQAVELLQRLRADAGPVDLNVVVYADLVELIERSGYGPCQSDWTAITGLQQPPCLTFVYDWRQDNVGNAIRLGRFLERARAHLESLEGETGAQEPREVRFDLIAHSMGGLLARYLLRYGPRDVLAEEEPPITWSGAGLLDRLIVISSPNFGSMRVLKEMIHGRSFGVAQIEPAMILTWPSTYQMLPRSHHAVWLDRAGDPVEIDILSTDLWRENGWGPFAPGQDLYLSWIFPDETTGDAVRNRMAAFMSVAFERARSFQEVMDREPDRPCPTELTLFAADVQPTLARAVLSDRDGRKVLVFDDVKGIDLRAPGDGSVTRASAVADERLGGGSGGFVTSPVPWHRQIFLTDMHRTFLGNPTFQNNLLHILLETRARRADRT